MRLSPTCTLLFIGDSITDAERDGTGESTPWNHRAGLGHGYVNLVNALLANKYPESRIRIVNKGIGGNTIRDLDRRWKKDVLDHTPDWLSIKIGINDVWRQFDTPLKKDTHVPPDEFEATYERLISQTRPHLKGLILISPYIIEPNQADPMRQRMDLYGTIVATLAKKHDALFVDAQSAMDRLTDFQHPTELAWDRIHPSTVGHMALAQQFLNAIEG